MNIKNAENKNFPDISECIKQGKTIHFIGIGGIGMSSIAKILSNFGIKVQGSDLSNGENIKSLEDAGIKVFIGHDENNLEGADVIIYSDAVPANNVELVKAKEKNICLMTRAEALDSIMNAFDKKSIAVSGTHGKTTTSSMVSILLDEAKLDPTIINGGIINYYGDNAKVGDGEYTVVEACEAFGNIKYFNPYISVITNIEPEHMEYYITFENLMWYFEDYIRRTKGFSVICIDDKNAKDLAEKLSGVKNIITYSLTDESADIYVKNINENINGASFDVIFNKDNTVLECVKLPVFGKHNISNALVAIAIGNELGIDKEILKKAPSHFTGNKHRFTKVSEANGLTIIDDYAHHPTEIDMVLSTADNIRKENSDIVAVFQPHRYTRFSDLFNEFLDCFSKADKLIVMNVYSAGEEVMPKFTSDVFVKRIKEKGIKNVTLVKDENDLAKTINDITKENDIVICMGAGSIKELVYKLPEQLKNL